MIKLILLLALIAQLAISQKMTMNFEHNYTLTENTLNFELYLTEAVSAPFKVSIRQTKFSTFSYSNMSNAYLQLNQKLFKFNCTVTFEYGLINIICNIIEGRLLKNTILYITVDGILNPSYSGLANSSYEIEVIEKGQRKFILTQAEYSHSFQPSSDFSAYLAIQKIANSTGILEKLTFLEITGSAGG